MTLLDVRNLTKIFHLGKGADLVAAHDVSLTLAEGETLGLVGESGSGKTTVGRCILRLLEPTAGEILLEGVDIAKLPADRLRELRARMQLVFQDPFASLNPSFTVRRTVSEPLALLGMDREGRNERIAEMLRQVGLGKSVLDCFPADLTAGEQQRVGIARALVTQPRLVILDEPTSTLDPSARADILALLQSVQRETGTAYIFISHDLISVARLSHRIAVMYLGHIVETAPTAQLMKRQLHPYSRALLSAVLVADPEISPSAYVIEGEIPTAINPKPECPLYGRCPIRRDDCRSGIPPLREAIGDHRTACLHWRDVATGMLQPQGAGA